MRTLRDKRTHIFVALVLAALGIGIFLLLQKKEDTLPPPVTESEDVGPEHRVIGLSVEGREIEAYTFGNGATHLVFVGGIHGGYEWNSVLLAYKFIDYLETNQAPAHLTVSVIPSANPDGVYEVVGVEGRFGIADVPTRIQAVGTGRFNANKVDLNRNFDCKWKPNSMWRGAVVSAGSAAFSEPEAQAIRDFVLKYTPDAFIFWHSKANAVYASECEAGILPETLEIMTAYSSAAGYNAVKTFDAYEITGDAEGWLASKNIPAITVELQTHETIEWEKNLAGIKALFEHYQP